jgi:hypothetical protein
MWYQERLLLNTLNFLFEPSLKRITHAKPSCQPQLLLSANPIRTSELLQYGLLTSFPF